uniref:Uncharacterized protein n=1 Tax=Ditylum brightwellii TaxID=49249 RepID=A0A7S4RK44_9STRA
MSPTMTRKPRRICVKSAITENPQEDSTTKNNKTDGGRLAKEEKQLLRKELYGIKDEGEDESTLPTNDISVYTGKRRRQRRSAAKKSPSTNPSAPSSSGGPATNPKKANSISTKKRKLKEAKEEEMLLELALQMARYEVDVDPYRGIFASSDSSSSSTNTSNPWACCAQALAAQPLAVTDDDNNDESLKNRHCCKAMFMLPILIIMVSTRIS